MKRWAKFVVAAIAVAACQDAPGPVTGPVAVTPAPVFLRDGGLPDRYIVVLADAAQNDGNVEQEIAARNEGEVSHSYRNALKGFAARLTPAAVARLARDPRVKFIEQDQVVYAIATQTGATWGLDRVDQRDLPLNGTYIYNADGTGVTAYIIDTGIRFDHAEFVGRTRAGYDAITSGAADCNGHGTHVAGTVGGTTYGVAKKVSLVAVRVLDCSGSGSTAGVIAGVDWVTGDHAAGTPAVANMSLGGGASTALDNAVINSVADGVTYGVAAGNDNLNACNYSPARAGPALTVGSTTNTDARSSFSNFGTCVDIFAPGSSITSAWYTTATATNTISGTSMATPHVVGAAALYLQGNPAATPAQVETALESNATPNKVTSAGTGSPNLLLYTAFISAAPQPPVADFTFSCNLLTCNFDGSASSAQATATYTWAYGDATTGSGKTSSHSYAAAGTYSVTLTVTDAIGTSTKTKTVTVSNSPPPTPAPVANFTFTCSGLTCTFTNTSTAQANATWVWVWGDGTPNSTAKTPPAHTFPRAATYQVSLTATDAGGSHTVTKPVTVVAACTNGNCQN